MVAHPPSQEHVLAMPRVGIPHHTPMPSPRVVSTSYNLSTTPSKQSSLLHAMSCLPESAKSKCYECVWRRPSGRSKLCGKT